MVPYDQLLPIEQAIVAWKIAHPVLFATILALFIAVVFITCTWLYVNARKIERERQRAERARKRAWIKSQGGL